MSDPRIAELEAFARENGLTLPLPADLIVFFEDHQRVVDLESSVVYTNVTVTPEPCAQAICHLLDDDYADNCNAYGDRTEY